MVVHGDVDEALYENLGEDYGKVIEYKWIDLIGNYKAVLPKYYSIKEPYTLESEDPSVAFEEAVEKFSDYTYDVYQTDPNKLFTEGGNCQAVSLYLYDTFKRSGYETGLVLEPDHMYPWVIIEGVKYRVDLVKNIIKEMS